MPDTYPGLSLAEVLVLINDDLLPPDSVEDDWREEYGRDLTMGYRSEAGFLSGDWGQ